MWEVLNHLGGRASASSSDGNNIVIQFFQKASTLLFNTAEFLSTNRISGHLRRVFVHVTSSQNVHYVKVSTWAIEDLSYRHPWSIIIDDQRAWTAKNWSMFVRSAKLSCKSFVGNTLVFGDADTVGVQVSDMTQLLLHTTVFVTECRHFWWVTHRDQVYNAYWRSSGLRRWCIVAGAHHRVVSKRGWIFRYIFCHAFLTDFRDFVDDLHIFLRRPYIILCFRPTHQNAGAKCSWLGRLFELRRLAYAGACDRVADASDVQWNAADAQITHVVMLGSAQPAPVVDRSKFDRKPYHGSRLRYNKIQQNHNKIQVPRASGYDSGFLYKGKLPLEHSARLSQYSLTLTLSIVQMQQASIQRGPIGVQYVLEGDVIIERRIAFVENVHTAVYNRFSNN